jgi:hypothetical protein
MATAKAVLRNIDFSMGGDTADKAIYAPRTVTPHPTGTISSNSGRQLVCAADLRA